MTMAITHEELPTFAQNVPRKHNPLYMPFTLFPFSTIDEAPITATPPLMRAEKKNSPE